MSSRIIATAAKAPDQVITNDDLAKIVDTSDEWIVQRTGIRSRHISNGENTSVFVIDVAKQLIEKASVNAEDIDLIIVASVTPDYGTPSLACMVQKEIHAINAVAFDITAACTGFIFALNTADVYSALWEMKESGYFKYTSGFIFGKPAICENEYNISYEETLKDALGDLHVPVIYNADIGHVPPQLAIINGSIAEIISKDGKGIITCKKI